MGNVEDALQSALPVLVQEPARPKGRRDSSDISESDSDTERDQVEIVVNPRTPPVREFSDLGVVLTFHREDVDKVDACIVERCSAQEKNTLVKEILAGKTGQFGSDIFMLNDPSISCKHDVTVSVKLSRELSKRHKVQVLTRVEENWQSEDATLNKGKTEFKTRLRGISHFVIVYGLEKKSVKISPTGTKLTIDKESKLEVDIPAGAVETDEEFTVEVMPPDRSAMKKYTEGEKPVCKSVVGLTECIYTNSPSLDLKKPITVKLPFGERQDKADDTTVVAFKMDSNKEIHMVDPNTEVTVDEEGVCNIEVQDLKGYCAAVVKNDCLKNVSGLEKEINLLYGTQFVGTILTFKEKKKMPTGYPKLWVELVDKTKVQQVVEMRTERDELVELPNSRSQDISIFDGFRLRIDVDGGLQTIRDIPKNFYLMTYMSTAEEHHRCFPVERPGVLNTNFGRLVCLSDKGDKRQVHELFLDNVGVFDKVYRRDGVQERQPSNVLSVEATGAAFVQGERELQELIDQMSSESPENGAFAIETNS